MGYFSQLARETLTRVIPPRQPLWLPPIAPMVQESVVEWPAAPVVNAVSEPNRVHRAAESSGEPVTGRQPPADESAGTNPVQRSYPSRADESRAEPPREHVEIEKYFNRETERATPRQNFGDAPPAPQSTVPSPSLDRYEARAVPAAVLPPQRSETGEAAVQHSRPATLAAVVSEIARLQQEFDRRYRAEQASTRSGSSPAETMRPEQRAEPASEGVSLNIGSIVVQMEPEPAAVKSTPKPAPRRPPSESHHHWKRSFLDRQ